MSLVERALKKIQESRGHIPASAAMQPTSQTITLDVAPRAAAVPPPLVTQAVTVERVPSIAPEPVRPSQIVHIDRDELRHAELLAPQAQARQLAGEYRHIKRPLIANALGRGVEKLPNGHRIMVASAMPGDGKTFTSINLALSFALEKDLSVVLVDADVAKAHLSRTFGLTSNMGLMDLLRDETLRAESLILPTDVPGLSLLPAGKAGDDTATELLASARMEAIARQITAHDPNRIVLFDSSPLLVTSEAIVLAGVVGQILLVVRAGMTPQSAVLDAIDLLGEGKSIGLVLNQTDDPFHSGYYYRYSYAEQGVAEGEAELTANVPPASQRGDTG